MDKSIILAIVIATIIEMIIPNGVTIIPSHAFGGCTSLTTVFPSKRMNSLQFDLFEYLRNELKKQDKIRYFFMFYILRSFMLIINIILIGLLNHKSF